ncbi:hypothetical protein TRVL_08431 [Trypanosoma vivax]|uniref:Uncharacterized protein n=1 Tax=Trypanosoma vivax (strain Y486) TaxID=1055687 RepID=G0U042_TRYVY|nr:hypothetical protein TRVL_08431 [Trypanosoma vivax]CCC49439.1 hypothetical protein, unlikely [Trypanosoma vivax Y486]
MTDNMFCRAFSWDALTSNQEALGTCSIMPCFSLSFTNHITTSLPIKNTTVPHTIRCMPYRLVVWLYLISASSNSCIEVWVDHAGYLGEELKDGEDQSGTFPLLIISNGNSEQQKGNGKEVVPSQEERIAVRTLWRVRDP